MPSDEKKLTRKVVPLQRWVQELTSRAALDAKVVALYDGNLPVIPVEMLRLAGLNLTSAETIVENDASGRQPVVEQNSSTISSRVLDGAYWGMAAAPPSFGRSTVSSTAPYLRRGILAVDATCTAGGELSATTLVPAVVGYTGYCYIEKVWSDQTDAGATITVTGGTPTPFTIVTAANTVTDLGIWLSGTADDTAISIAAAAGQFGVSQVLQIQGTYHYET